MKKRDFKCNCIRCREVRERYDPEEKFYLVREDYSASGGKEVFLSFENKERNKLFAFLRLRIPSQVFKKEEYFIPVLKGSAIIREVHTYGQQIPIENNGEAPQHKGLGKKLIKEAEKITKTEFGLSKITVISGVGVRDYYRKLGYQLENEYVVKEI